MEKDKRRAIRRKLDFKKAIRKKKIAESIYIEDYGAYGSITKHKYYDNIHQYSKNKIHCSCGKCCNKTHNKNKRNVYGNYAPSFNPTISDKRKLDKLFYEGDEINDN